MTGDDIKAARRRLGMTQAQLAAALKMSAPNGARRVRAWEQGSIEISGPAEVALRLMLAMKGDRYVGN
jgi:DNA-binding transcriptional regulator YiaG